MKNRIPRSAALSMGSLVDNPLESDRELARGYRCRNLKMKMLIVLFPCGWVGIRCVCPVLQTGAGRLFQVQSCRHHVWAQWRRLKGCGTLLAFASQKFTACMSWLLITTMATPCRQRFYVPLCLWGWPGRYFFSDWASYLIFKWDWLAHPRSVHRAMNRLPT